MYKDVSATFRVTFSRPSCDIAAGLRLLLLFRLVSCWLRSLRRSRWCLNVRYMLIGVHRPRCIRNVQHVFSSFGSSSSFRRPHPSAACRGVIGGRGWSGAPTGGTKKPPVGAPVHPLSKATMCRGVIGGKTRDTPGGWVYANAHGPCFG